MIKLEKYVYEDELIHQIKKLFVSQNTSEVEVSEKFKNLSLIKSLDAEISALGIDYSCFKNKKETLVECIIAADFQEIKKIKEIIDKSGDCLFRVDKKLIPIWKKYIYYYGKAIKNDFNIILANNLKIKTCPYCNENYITMRNNKSSFQLDHFFPKSIYPIFALSLYNLIPSCYACNHNKKEKLIGISPFDITIDFERIKITHIPRSYNYFLDEKEFDIVVYSENTSDDLKLDLNQKELGIGYAYNFHKDYMLELIKKSIFYNSSTIKSMFSAYSSLFSSEEEITRIIFANYHHSENLNQRPLSKMTMDFLKEYGIVK